jgi:hypothetical protein
MRISLKQRQSYATDGESWRKPHAIARDSDNICGFLQITLMFFVALELF